MALLGVLPCGCLVTDKQTFEGQPNSPPVILSKTGQPTIGMIVWIDNVQPEWQLEVQVRDEDVDQVLQAQWRVWRVDDPDPMFDTLDDIERTGEPIRNLQIRVNTANLVNYRCHRLELLVSGSFIGFTDPDFFGLVAPGDEADVARASWLIWEGQGLDTPPMQLAEIAQSCETIKGVMPGEAPTVMEPMR